MSPYLAAAGHQKSRRRKWDSGAWACEIVLESFQALASPYLAAAGHQKIQPQEMRIWGLGWQNCFKLFSGTCVPLSGRSRPPKIQPQEMRIWAWQNFPRFPQGHFSLQAEELWAKIWHGFPFFVDCENWEEQLSNFWRTTKNESVVLFFLLLESCSFAPLIFSMYGGFALVTLSKSRSVSERRNSCFQDRAVSSAFYEFSGARVPLSGRSRPPKNPATGKGNLRLGLAKLF